MTDKLKVTDNSERNPVVEHTLYIRTFLGMLSNFEIVFFSSFGWSQEITNSLIVYFKITSNQWKKYSKKSAALEIYMPLITYTLVIQPDFHSPLEAWSIGFQCIICDIEITNLFYQTDIQKDSVVYDPLRKMLDSLRAGSLRDLSGLRGGGGGSPLFFSPSSFCEEPKSLLAG